MNTYIYYALADTKCETIGRVTASSMRNALIQIANIKKIPKESVLEIFAVKQLN